MASSATFPNPYLAAILLICSTRTGGGAQIVFQYPPDPHSHHRDHSHAYSTIDTADDETSTDSEESTTGEDDLFTQHNVSSRQYPQHQLSLNKSLGGSDEHTNGSTTSQTGAHNNQHNDHLFGLAEDGLVSMLTPDRTWHKRKFELGINDLTFVGRPVFVRQDGFWRKSKKHKQQGATSNPDASDSATDHEERPESTDTGKHGAPDDQTTLGKSQLTMFNLVFVMNPPPLEHTLRVKDMYDHIIKKFSRALKYEQTHDDYLWKESELISAVKAAALVKRSNLSSLTTDILAKSSLAVAIQTVYTAISNSRIASVKLSPKVSFSLQIPPITSTSYLPSLTDPPIQPGLWLTTAPDIDPDSETTDPGDSSHVAKHYTLLLKSPPHRIAKDAIEAGGLLAQHLPKFVSSLRPTKSFYKISVSSQTSLADIQVLAQHLIYWRKAVAIPPLHQKDVYIVSPNADMRKLREATKSYEHQFAPTMPNMPSLPKILSALSGIPRPFGSLIPSTDHKEIYYLALAWLMRNGWVTQLRTFAYIRIDPDMKRAVRIKDRQVNSRSYARPRDEMGAGKDLGKPKKRPSIISRPSSEGKRSMDDNGPAHNPRMASLILNPPKASTEESKWLDHLESCLTAGSDLPFNLSDEDRAELQKHWSAFTKYFNGHIALETIPVRQGLKRKFFWGLLDKVGLDLERGVEDGYGGKRTILVSVRHW